MRAGFLLDAGVKNRVGLPGKTGIGFAHQRDELHAHALDDRQDGKNFRGLAGVGNGEHDVGGGDHAKVAVRGLARVHEEGGGAGAGEGGGDLAADVAALAHAGDDDAPLAGEHQTAGIGELPVEARRQRLQRLGLELDHLASQLLE